MESEWKGGSDGADKALVVGLNKMNLTKSKQTCLAEMPSLLRREIRNDVVKFSLWYFMKYFEILPATPNSKSSSELLKILE